MFYELKYVMKLMIDRDVDPIEIRNTLSRLKARGCNMLVVGDAPPESFAEYSRQALGGDELERARLVGLTRLTPDARDWLPNGVEPVDELTAALVLSRQPRGAVDVPSSETGPGPDLETPSPPDGEISDPHTTVADTATEFEELLAARVSKLSATAPELRITVSSISDLLVCLDDAETLYDRLDELTDRIESTRGMGFYHVPKPLSSEDVRFIEPLFDGVVVLRRTPSDGQIRTQQRVIVPKQDGVTKRHLSTPWTNVNPGGSRDRV